MAILAIDFDHTLVEGDKAIDGAREAINNLREKGHKIVIHSANELGWIIKTLNNLDIRFDKVVAGKLLADCYIDDKSYHFEGDWTKATPEILKRVEGLDNRKW